MINYFKFGDLKLSAMYNAHKNLAVWIESLVIVKQLYKLSASFPSEEKFGLISQIRRAAISVPSNIAEGSARRSKKEFLNFLSIARGSLTELDTLIELSYLLNLISTEECTGLTKKIERIAYLLAGLIKKIEKDIRSKNELC